MAHLTPLQYGLIAVAVVIVGAVIYMLVTRNTKEHLVTGPHMPTQLNPAAVPASREQNPPVDVNAPTLIMFYATWCHFCTEYKPIWEQAKQVLVPHIQVYELESANINPQRFGAIPGFPTIRFYPEGISNSDAIAKALEYKGDRTNPASLVNWIKSGGKQ